MADKLAWGIISTGSIANRFASALPHTQTGKLVAVASRSEDKANHFAQLHGGVRAHGSYEALLADDEVQSVYVATPHPMHVEWVIKAAEAGKHILCEKPLGLNHAEAMAMIETAREHDVFLMEAFMYRCHPQTQRLVDLIRDGAIGQVRIIQATHGFGSRFDPSHRLYADTLGGGAILDVGCYPISLSRLIAGAAMGRDFVDPVDVTGAAHRGETGVDHWAVATLTFPDGIFAQCRTSIVFTEDPTARIVGTDGTITVPSPWRATGFEGGSSEIILQRSNSKPETITLESTGWLYGIQADTVAAHLASRQVLSPAMSWDDTLGNMKTLDRWRSAIGLIYEAEKPANIKPVHRRPLKVRIDSQMTYGRVPRVEKKVSRLVLGTDEKADMTHTAVMFDDFFERGGNTFDTAYIYRDGQAERKLGQWIRSRGVRDEVLVIGKGAHSPHCNPDAVTKQLQISLERLQIDCVDIYFLHRDNLEIPVGEFVGVLNENHRAGRIKSFGGSNWTIPRISEANTYADQQGLIGFSVLSNNLSLARMVNPLWEGVVSSSDPEWLAWLAENQMPVFSWSSQARGFFTDRAGPDKLSDTLMAQSWYSEDNFERRRRAAEMATKKQVEPINIALAYVLRQPFPTFPIVGPRLISETRSSCQALDIELTPDELAWLDLGERV